MATRNLTKRFEELRSGFRHPPRTNQKSDGHESLLGDVDLSDSPVQYVLPPGWVELAEAVQRDILSIKDFMRQLEERHSERLRAHFGDDEAQLEQNIEIMTARITSIFKKSENGVKRIAVVASNTAGGLPERERMVRLNVMRSLGSELQGLSKNFRAQQRSYLRKLKSQGAVGKQFYNDEDSNVSNLVNAAMDRVITLIVRMIYNGTKYPFTHSNSGTYDMKYPM